MGDTTSDLGPSSGTLGTYDRSHIIEHQDLTDFVAFFIFQDRELHLQRNCFALHIHAEFFLNTFDLMILHGF
ncbi:hypothetical protein D3C87_2146240 [compost metagenome]